MFLLDTNVLSELMRAEPDATLLGWVDAQIASTLHISAITVAEVSLGVALLPAGKRRDALEAAAARVFAHFQERCLAFDARAADIYGQLVAARTRLGRPITVEDAQIAAIALAHGVRLATRNTRDFDHIPDLETIDPWTATA